MTVMTEKSPGTIGPYRLETELGRGAFGVVYKAYHSEDSRTPVALKVIDGGGNTDQLLTEPSLLEKLQHPNVVGLRDYFIHDEKLVMVLEFIDGGDLKSATAGERKLPPEDVRMVLQSMATALLAAQRENIVHRDIKLANIMVDQSGDSLRYVLADFGIGRISKEIQQTRHAGGTIAFMAPEQLRGRPTPQSDIWALGVVAYRLLTGKMPFSGDTLQEVSQSILYATPEPLSQAAGRDLPEGIEVTVMRMLEKSFHDRIESAEELLRELGGSSAKWQSSVAGRPTDSTERCSGMQRYVKRLRRWQSITLILTVFVTGVSLLGQGAVYGALTLAGLVVFFRSQLASSQRLGSWKLLATALVLLLLAHASARLGWDFRAYEWLPSLAVLGWIWTILVPWWLLIAVLLAFNRRAARELAVRRLVSVYQNDPVRYLSELRESVDVRDGDVGFHLRYVEGLMAQDRQAEAVVECQLILHSDPYNFAASLLAANACLELGMVARCKAICQSYLSISGYCFEFEDLLQRCERLEMSE